MTGPVTPGDLWTLRRKPRSLALLYNEPMLARPHRWLPFTMRCMIEGNGRDGATLVYRERGMRALIQSIGRSGRPEQDVVLLAAHGGGRGFPSDLDVWHRLLESLCVLAGNYRVQRLYAALSHHHEEIREVFRQVGFQAYTQQHVLQLEGPDWDQGTVIAPMRPQTRRDIWAIHKLYGAITPRPVQLAEARDSRTWHLPLAGRRKRQRAWVLGDEDNLTAYLHLTSGPAAHIFTLLLQPDARDITTDILRFGLGQLQDALPVYLLLRDYQRELMLPSGDLGFQPVAEQALLFKQTTTAVRRPILSLGSALEPGLEARGPVPTIAPVRGEDTQFYDRATRHHQQHRPATGSAAGTHPTKPGTE